MSIQFTDVCFITNDVPRLRAFYEHVFGANAEGDKTHSGISIDGLSLVFDHVDIANDNRTFRFIEGGGANNVIVGFNVDDVLHFNCRIHYCSYTTHPEFKLLFERII